MAFFDPAWQIATTIEFYFQYAVIAKGDLKQLVLVKLSLAVTQKVTFYSTPCPTCCIDYSVNSGVTILLC